MVWVASVAVWGGGWLRLRVSVWTRGRVRGGRVEVRGDGGVVTVQIQLSAARLVSIHVQRTRLPRLQHYVRYQR